MIGPTQCACAQRHDGPCGDSRIPDERAGVLAIDFGAFSSLWSIPEVITWLRWAARTADREATREERHNWLPAEKIRQLRAAAGRFHDLCEAITKANSAARADWYTLPVEKGEKP
jgi:hypothetical protein